MPGEPGAAAGRYAAGAGLRAGVGWSYGAFVICDFVRAYGQDQIAAIEFVEGAAKLGETGIPPIP